MKKLTACPAFAAALAFAAASFATTWCPEDVTCPVCGAENEFYAVMSWGTYIYDWPSKFELIYWPYTEGEVLYSCKGCKLTCFMYDFEDFPADKGEAARAALAGVDFGGPFASYLEIPTSERLAAAEKVYAVLDLDDDFWCVFWRVVGYHCAAEGKLGEAAEARRKALELAAAMSGDETRAGERKEFLAITGAMRHLTGDDEGALRDFTEALGLTYENAVMTRERNEGYDAFLAELLTEYVAKIKSGDEE